MGRLLRPRPTDALTFALNRGQEAGQTVSRRLYRAAAICEPPRHERPDRERRALHPPGNQGGLPGEADGGSERCGRGASAIDRRRGGALASSGAPAASERRRARAAAGAAAALLTRLASS